MVKPKCKECPCITCILAHASDCGRCNSCFKDTPLFTSCSRKITGVEAAKDSIEKSESDSLVLQVITGEVTKYKTINGRMPNLLILSDDIYEMLLNDISAILLHSMHDICRNLGMEAAAAGDVCAGM